MADVDTKLKPAGREIIFFEDFTSGEIDRSSWNVRVTGQTVNREQQAYVDSSETVYIDNHSDEANGLLIINPRYHPGFVTSEGERFDFVSGRIDTRGKMEFQYGTVSARIKLSSGAGLWSAFWVLGASGDWPQSGEIDIMENVGEPDWTSVAVHGPGYCGETPLVNKKFFLSPNATTTWHIYSLECTPSDGMTFFIDKEPIYRATPPMIDFYGPWVFDSRKYLVLNLALGGTYPFKTNGVHSPYYGIPEETVQLIRKDETKLLVDWVKVSKM